MARVIHHYLVPEWADGADYEVADAVPSNSKIIAAMDRAGKVVLYVEKTVTETAPAYQSKIEAFYVLTGEEFDQKGLYHDFDYVETVRIDRPSGFYFYHVYARIVPL